VFQFVACILPILQKNDTVPLKTTTFDTEAPG